jgi:predicted FMN-binding regulatory protein PaiB
MSLVRRRVDQFEAAVEEPWSLASTGGTAHEMAGQVVVSRLRARSWHAEAKRSQDKPEDEQARGLAALARDGARANASLAAAMRRSAH